MNAKQAALAAILLVPSASMAISPEVRRVTPSYRPYIVEVGDPTPLGPRSLEAETKRNSDLQSYIRFYGWPDYAEIQEIEPTIPWDSYEVRLFYLRRDRELAFGRAYISPYVNDLGLIKYDAIMDPATRDRIVALATPAPATASEEPERVQFQPVMTAAQTVPPSDIELMVQRIEAAAERASLAADNAAAASDAANASADRTVTILEKIAK